MKPVALSPKDDAELSRVDAAGALGIRVAPSVRLAYRSACAFLGRKPTGKARRRTIAEAQGVLRRKQQHGATVEQAKVAKARHKTDAQRVRLDVEQCLQMMLSQKP